MGLFLVKLEVLELGDGGVDLFLLESGEREDRGEGEGEKRKRRR